MNKSIIIRTTSFLLLMFALQCIVWAQRGNTDTLYVLGECNDNCTLGFTLNTKYITNHKPVRLILKRGKFYELKLEHWYTRDYTTASGNSVATSELTYSFIYLNGEEDTTFKNSNIGYLIPWENKIATRKEGAKLLSKIPLKIKTEEYVDPDAEGPKGH